MCFCGDTECGSCGSAQGTLEQDEEREMALEALALTEPEPDFCAKCGYEMAGGPDAVCMTTGRGYHADCVGL